MWWYILPKISPPLPLSAVYTYGPDWGGDLLLNNSPPIYILSPPPAKAFGYHPISAYIMHIWPSYGVYSHFELQYSSKKRHYTHTVDSTILARPTAIGYRCHPRHVFHAFNCHDIQYKELTNKRDIPFQTTNNGASVNLLVLFFAACGRGGGL